MSPRLRLTAAVALLLSALTPAMAKIDRDKTGLSAALDASPAPALPPVADVPAARPVRG